MDATARELLERTWRLNRVHVGPEADAWFAALQATYPVTLHTYASGATCNGWVVPPAWTVRRGQLRRMSGEVIADYAINPLMLHAYSAPFVGEVRRDELLPHLLWNEQRPAAIPFHFRTQYRHWETHWGFSVPFETVRQLRDASYLVEIDTSFAPSAMQVAEWRLPGAVDDTIVLSGHWDHPALVNDGLAGCIAGLEIIDRLRARAQQMPLHYSYAVVLTAELVGSVFYLANAPHARHLRDGLFIAMPGARVPLILQHSRTGRSRFDRLLPSVARGRGIAVAEGAYSEVVGNDEIAYEAPGIDVPMPSLARFPYPEYHTSDDDLAHFDVAHYDEVVALVLDAIELLERDVYPQRTFTGLPCLAHPSLDLYLPPRMMSQLDMTQTVAAAYAEYGQVLDPHFDGNVFVKKVWHLLEGDLSLFEIADRLQVPFPFIRAYLEKAADKGLVRFFRTPRTLASSQTLR